MLRKYAGNGNEDSYENEDTEDDEDEHLNTTNKKRSRSGESSANDADNENDEDASDLDQNDHQNLKATSRKRPKLKNNPIVTPPIDQLIIANLDHGFHKKNVDTALKTLQAVCLTTLSTVLGAVNANIHMSNLQYDQTTLETTFKIEIDAPEADALPEVLLEVVSEAELEPEPVPESKAVPVADVPIVVAPKVTTPKSVIKPRFTNQLSIQSGKTYEQNVRNYNFKFPGVDEQVNIHAHSRYFKFGVSNKVFQIVGCTGRSPGRRSHYRGSKGKIKHPLLVIEIVNGEMVGDILTVMSSFSYKTRRCVRHL